MLDTLTNKKRDTISNQSPGRYTIIPFEYIQGSARFGMNFLVSTKFAADSKFNFLSITNFDNGYQNRKDDLDFVSNTQVGYNFFNRLSVIAGMAVKSATGSKPVIGLNYLYADKTWLFVLTPDLEITQSRNIEILSVLEFRPMLTKRLMIYSRLQGLYNFSTLNGSHQRSYLQFRLGPGTRNVQAGFAANIDYFGPMKRRRDNYGVFLRYYF